MKKMLLLLVCCLFWGCESYSERATVNYQKGDKFFEMKEYDVAVYYFEMIPEDNPLYPQAKKKLAEIQKIHDIEREAINAATDVSNVSVLNQSFLADKSGRFPAHKVRLRNESSHVLKSVVLEFTYLDGMDHVVDVLKCGAETAIYSHNEDSFSDIRPGMVKRPFADCRVKVLSADFK
ncbi:MAG: hypothetical protein NTV54_16670 [Ignavibacteriales bacterium]|nr:hypothetical protein [Ignavibacteriales bacterium]